MSQAHHRQCSVERSLVTEAHTHTDTEACTHTHSVAPAQICERCWVWLITMQFCRKVLCQPCSARVTSPEEDMEYKMGSCIGISHSQVNRGVGVCWTEAVCSVASVSESVQEEAEQILLVKQQSWCTTLLEEGRRQQGEAAEEMESAGWGREEPSVKGWEGDTYSLKEDERHVDKSREEGKVHMYYSIHLDKSLSGSRGSRNLHSKTRRDVCAECELWCVSETELIRSVLFIGMISLLSADGPQLKVAWGR